MTNPTPNFQTLNYTNNTFEVGKRKVPNSFLLSTYPNYAVSPQIILIHYMQSGKDNIVKYKDGKQENLSQFEPKYNEFILKFQEFYVAYKSTQLKNKERQKLNTITSNSIDLITLFQEDITFEEQQNIIEKINSNVYSEKVTDKNLLEFLKDLKLDLLQESDFSQLADVQATLSEDQKTAWVKYRAALRELDKTKDPLSVRIPNSPEDIF